ncbi:MAG: T9SS type A sorting domain-containing protein, partial [Bacteroidetes bacterium]|nr:T9SS type A sorting domain-containing protein [Bacteroidota bacterium]
LVNTLINAGMQSEAEAKIAEIKNEAALLPATLSKEVTDMAELYELDIEIASNTDLFEDVVNNNYAMLTEIAESETHPGSVYAQYLLEKAGIKEYPEIIKLPSIPDIENHTIEGSILENPLCGNATVYGAHIRLIDNHGDTVPGISDAVSDEYGIFMFNVMEIYLADPSTLCTFETEGFGIEYPGIKTLAEWIKDENILLTMTDVNLEWAETYSSPDSLYNIGSAIDLDGNIYVAGTCNDLQSGSDIVLIRYDKDGTQEWVVRYNGQGNGYDYLKDMFADDDGTVYLTGTSLNAAGNFDIVTLCYYRTGFKKWEAQYDGQANSADQPVSIEKGGNGNIHVTGSSYGTDVMTDIVLLSYSPDGAVNWSARFDSGSDDQPYDMAIDNDDNIIIGGASGTHELSDFILLKYNPQGTLICTAGYDNGGLDAIRKIAVDEANNIYLAAVSRDVSIDILTAKYSPAGQQVWSDRYHGVSGTDEKSICGIKSDPEGEMIVTGSSDNEFLCIKYSADGDKKWITSFKSIYENGDIPNSMDIDNEGIIYMTGFSRLPGTTKSGDIVTVSIDTYGVLKWDQYFSLAPGKQNQGYDVVVSPNRNVYVTGYGSDGYVQNIVNLKYSQCFGLSGLKSLVFAFPDEPDEENTEKFSVVPEKYRLYPNPGNGDLIVEYETADGLDGILTVSDLAGKEIKRYRLYAENAHRIFINDGASFENGVYIYNFITGNRIVKRDKLVIIKN